MKKLIFLGLFLSLFFSVSFLASADEGISLEDVFEDMSDDHENATAINFLYQLEVIEGYENEDGTREYKPNQEVNRAEFLKILMGGEFTELEMPSEPCFPDVKETEWYAPYVCTAKEEGWIQGYPDGLFRPGQTINKVESLKVLSEVAEWEVEEAATGEAWYQPYLDIAEDLNLVVLEENDAFMTRGDTAEVIFRQLQVIQLSVDQYLESKDDELFEYYGLSYDPADVEHLVIYGSIFHSGSTTVGESITVTVELYDEEDNLVSGHALEAIVTTPHSYEVLDVEEENAGIYVVELSSFTAATYGVFVRDTDTGEIYDTTVSFEAGEAESMDILNVVYPYENEDHTGTFDVVLRDEYGNTVGEDESALDFSTTMGEVSTYFADGVWSVTLSSEEVGEATVSIEGSFEDEVDFSFDSVLVGSPRGVEDGDSFTVPVYINMGNEGDLGSYDISIVYNSGYLQFEDAVDGDSSDDFNAPAFSLTGNTLRLYQDTNTGAATGQYVHVADLLFSTVIVGSSTIYAEDATLTNTDGLPLGNMLLQQVSQAPVVVKRTKNVCMQAFVLEGSETATQADIQLDIAVVEAAFKAAADACNCPYYISLELHYKLITQAVWHAKTAGYGKDGELEDEVVDWEETSRMAGLYAQSDCVPVFYVPMLEVDDATIEPTDWSLGGYTQPGDPSYIALDRSRDNSVSNALGHELLHLLSGMGVEDFDPRATEEENANAVAQGAKDPDNIMNYDDPGLGISAAQCELIYWAGLPNK